MAENKKSFVLYTDLLHTIENLPDEISGKLFKMILLYVNDGNPQTEDLLLKIAFEPIKQQLDRDFEKWKDIKSAKSDNGQLGNLKKWNPNLYEKVKNGEIELMEAVKIAKSRKPSQSDNSDRKPSQDVAKVAVTVSDTVNVNVTVLISKKCEEILNSSLWKERVAMNKKITIQRLNSLLKEFLDKESLKSDFLEKSIPETRDHFVNWMAKQGGGNMSGIINHGQPVN